jgi:hypothetical protein
LNLNDTAHSDITDLSFLLQRKNTVRCMMELTFFHSSYAPHYIIYTGAEGQ